VLSALATLTFYESYSEANTSDDLLKYTYKSFNIIYLQENISSDLSSTFIIWLDKMPIGYCKLNWNTMPENIVINSEKVAEIQRIYILNQHQKSGIGTSFFEHIRTIIKQKNKNFVWLGVWKNNEKAIRFYTKMKMNVIGNRQFKLGEAVYDDYIFGCDI
jgi:ribosomal protein S18 acetylase RimI-like enzyme